MWTLTVNEYRALSPRQKLVYRLYRNPFVMLGLGPVYLILIAYRFNRKDAGRKERRNTYLTNMMLFSIFAILCLLLGWKSVLIIEGPILFISAMAGIWLFYVQHQFEGTYFEAAESWDFVNAALQGSSFYRLPSVLQWFTGNIGYHHVHHLGPRVPNYNLQRTHESASYLRDVPTISLRRSFQSVHFRLWDEERKKFVRFRDVVIAGGS